MKPKYGLFAGIVLVVLAAGVYLVFGGGDAPAEQSLEELSLIHFSAPTRLSYIT